MFNIFTIPEHIEKKCPILTYIHKILTNCNIIQMKDYSKEVLVQYLINNVAEYEGYHKQAREGWEDYEMVVPPYCSLA